MISKKEDTIFENAKENIVKSKRKSLKTDSVAILEAQNQKLCLVTKVTE